MADSHTVPDQQSHRIALTVIHRYRNRHTFRYVGNPPIKMYDSYMEVTLPGERCDWTAGTVYDILGMVAIPNSDGDENASPI